MSQEREGNEYRLCGAKNGVMAAVAACAFGAGRDEQAGCPGVSRFMEDHELLREKEVD